MTLKAWSWFQFGRGEGYPFWMCIKVAWLNR